MAEDMIKAMTDLREDQDELSIKPMVIIDLHEDREDLKNFVTMVTLGMRDYEALGTLIHRKSGYHGMHNLFSEGMRGAEALAITQAYPEFYAEAKQAMKQFQRIISSPEYKGPMPRDMTVFDEDEVSSKPEKEDRKADDDYYFNTGQWADLGEVCQLYVALLKDSNIPDEDEAKLKQFITAFCKMGIGERSSTLSRLRQNSGKKMKLVYADGTPWADVCNPGLEHLWTSSHMS
jgi:hypothetical protein